MAMRRLSRMFRRSTKTGLARETDQSLEVGEPSADAWSDQMIGAKYHEDSEPSKIRKFTTKVMMIKEHKNCAAQLEEMKDQLSAYRTILQQMSDVYQSSREQCPCFRYSTLERLVVEAVKEYNHVHSTTQEERDDETSMLLSPVERLKDDSGRYSDKRHSLEAQIQYYSDVSEKELKKEVEVYKLELERLNREHDDVVGKLETLEKGHRQISNYCYLRRYVQLKHLIEDAVVDCLVDS